MEILESEINFRLMCNCKEVQHCIGRTAKSHHRSDCIFKCFLRQNIASGDSFRDEVYNCGASGF